MRAFLGEGANDSLREFHVTQRDKTSGMELPALYYPFKLEALGGKSRETDFAPNIECMVFQTSNCKRANRA